MRAILILATGIAIGFMVGMELQVAQTEHCLKVLRENWTIGIDVWDPPVPPAVEHSK